MFGRRRAQAEAQPKRRGGRAAEVPERRPDNVSSDAQLATVGPYDVAEAPDDGRLRLDLGSLRLPVPQGAQLQVEVDSSGPVRAVHLMTGLGQVTLTPYAAPRSGGLWREVCRELVNRLRADGARVGRAAGEWGEEIEAVTAQGVLRFLAVDGPRWMLRGVAVGSAEHAEARTALLREVVREAVVVRGPEPLPVRSPLPLQLPGPLAEQLKQATVGPDNAATVGDGGSARQS